MPVWDIKAATHQLRSLIGDAESDKFVFRQDCLPTPDGRTVEFHTGDTRLVDGTLVVIRSGVEVDDLDSDAVDTARGSFVLNVAPSGNEQLQASYYYQWFDDDQLLDFFTTSVNLLGFGEVGDASLPLGLRPVAIHWAAACAFVKKAAEFADSLSGQAPLGYTVDRKHVTPNWTKLAELEFTRGKDLLKTYGENPLAVAAPSFGFVTFRQQVYVPRS